MTGFESKRVMSNSRHADDVTITDLIRLRRENEALQSQLKNALDVVTRLMKENKELKGGK